MITSRKHSLAEYLIHNAKANGDCIEWTGSKDKDGYGKACFNYKRVRAHRLSYEHFYGEFDKALHVLHWCDNPSCINPNHLFLGDNNKNIQDKVAKGRQLNGEKIGNSKLSPEGVKNIRALRTNGATLKSIAETYNISIANVWDICKGNTWRHL